MEKLILGSFIKEGDKISVKLPSHFSLFRLTCYSPPERDFWFLLETSLKKDIKTLISSMNIEMLYVVNVKDIYTPDNADKKAGLDIGRITILNSDVYHKRITIPSASGYTAYIEVIKKNISTVKNTKIAIPYKSYIIGNIKYEKTTDYVDDIIKENAKEIKEDFNKIFKIVSFIGAKNIEAEKQGKR